MTLVELERWSKKWDNHNMDQKRKTTRGYPDKIWSIIQDPKGCVKFFQND